MKSTDGTLEQIRIAEPCNASWDRMQGDERVRFCGECRKNVYNLSAMSREEAEGLVHELEGHLCVRFYQRRDGTVLTDNCPVGVRKARAWLSVQLAGIAATFASLLSLAPVERSEQMGNARAPQVERQQFVILNQKPVAMMGDVASPPPPPVRMGRIASPRATMMGSPTPPPPSSPKSSRR
jgi:hypothetical protein